ncbi:MAG: alpha-1,2-fucosyltransferase [Bacteroidales bacterium]|nr:alpha-1,2-fucosyltransferase [Bacteroidales bacterium]
MRKKSKNTLLITGAIDISNFSVPFVKITDLKERLQQYLESLEHAINHYFEVDHIVFCENTNYKHDYSELQEKAKKRGKELEILTFQGNYEMIEKKGKGYGEGEIIKYALNHSAILSQSDCFYKLTGRVAVANMDRIMRSTKSVNAFIFSPFHERNFDKYTRTLFYKVSTSFYKQKLLNAYLAVDDSQDMYLEHVFFDKLKDTPIKSFRIYPKLIGISASDGKTSYALSRKELFRSRLFSKFGFLDNHGTRKQKILFWAVRLIRKIKQIAKPKVIVRMDGGISSQMHQYLLGRMYAEKGYTVNYDLRWFLRYGKDQTGRFERNFELQRAFPNLDFKSANPLESRIYARCFSTKSNYFDHTNEDVFLFDITPPKYLGDYYHTPKELWRNLFPKYFRVNFEILGEQKALLDEIQQNKQSVAIHVRMGDLKEYNIAYGAPASQEYFQKAIDYIAQKTEQPFFYFFSDELELVENELLKKISIPSNSYKIVNTNSSDRGYMDLFLIAACKHQITSKGSLGKFGALLNDSPKKIVVLCDDSMEHVWKERLINPVFL